MVVEVAAAVVVEEVEEVAVVATAAVAVVEAVTRGVTPGTGCTTREERER